MKCAKCLESELKSEVHEGVQLHRCSMCNGLFLDDGVLETLVGRSASAVDPGGFTAISDRQDMQLGRCPKCQVVMGPYLGPRNMRLDRCPQCKGTFLDQGELATIVSP